MSAEKNRALGARILNSPGQLQGAKEGGEDEEERRVTGGGLYKVCLTPKPSHSPLLNPLFSASLLCAACRAIGPCSDAQLLASARVSEQEEEEVESTGKRPDRKRQSQQTETETA
eukprot:1024749-Rhodomonas_salina.1